jgi:hypothetical protein
MQRLSSPAPCAAVLLACFSAPVLAQSPFATSVVQFHQGTGGGIFAKDNVLGGPQGGGLGAGSLDVLTLGEGGDVTLGFDLTLADGPGADLTVFENGFLIGGGPSVFAELFFVEVSTDGATFARFPSRYAGSGSPMGAYRGIGGGMPVIADVTTGLVDALDPLFSGGEALDLADLAQEPAVLSGAVDLGAVHFVRLVDPLPGATDSFGTPIAAGGGSDVDAVAVLNSAGASPGGPTCDLFFDSAERLHLVLGDPDGFFALDFASLRASLNLAPLPLAPLVPIFQVQSASATEVHLMTPPLLGTGFVGALGLSVEDVDGHRSADQAMVQG